MSSGTFFDQNSSRTPVQIDALGQSWKVSELPGTINYSESEIGVISNGEISGETVDGIYQIWVVYMDEEA